MKKLIIILAALCSISVQAQTFVDIGATYPLNTDSNKYSTDGFIAFDKFSDNNIFSKALIWAVENISSKQHENINAINYASKDFKCKLIFSSIAGSNISNNYYCDATFRVAAGKLLFHFTNIMIKPNNNNVLFNKTTPLELLSPLKNVRHQQSIDDYVAVSSLILNKLFDHITSYKLAPITHWNDIKIKRIVEGMNRDECRMAVGKPQSIIESGGEVQWMYSSSFYVFFKRGVVTTIIK